MATTGSSNSGGFPMAMRLALWFLAGIALLFTGLTAHAETIRVYVGTYTNAKSKGIYLVDLDSETGKLSNLRLAAETAQPSFLAIYPNQKFLYAVSEIDNDGGRKTGAVAALTINPE